MDTQSVNETVMETPETESVIKEHDAASSIPTTESKIENKELEVESSVPSSESAVSAESEKAELKVEFQSLQNLLFQLNFQTQSMKLDPQFLLQNREK